MKFDKKYAYTNKKGEDFRQIDGNFVSPSFSLYCIKNLRIQCDKNIRHIMERGKRMQFVQFL